jgi:hypothetical protein
MNACSSSEIELCIAEHPCPTCGTPVAPSDLTPSVADAGALLRETHTGTCSTCGSPLHFELLAPRVQPQLVGFALGGDAPSELFAPDELLAIAERREAATPRDPEVPASAFFGPKGTGDRDANPARLQRATLERQRAAYGALADAYRAQNGSDVRVRLA